MNGPAHRIVPPLLTFTLAGLLAATTAGCGGDSDGQPVSVMTRNLYLGADLSPLTGALTPDALAALSAGVWRDVQASEFPARVLIIADEIARVAPDVVALQEVSIFRTQTPGDWQSGAPPNATTVELDFLQLLQDALRARGAVYQPASIGINADAELPAVNPDGSMFDVRLTDRDVILVKDGLTFAPGPAAIFENAARLPIGGAGGTTLVFHRGFVSADVTVGDRSVRVVDSHLEVGALLGRFQEDQARELITALAVPSGPTILAGDFNSRADGAGTASYALLTTKAGSKAPFRDVWSFRGPLSPAQVGGVFGDAPEFTCCLDIDSSTVALHERIDLILFRGAIDPVNAAVVTTEQTPAGLWPSDHLGVRATFQLR